MQEQNGDAEKKVGDNDQKWASSSTPSKKKQIRCYYNNK